MESFDEHQRDIRLGNQQQGAGNTSTPSSQGDSTAGGGNSNHNHVPLNARQSQPPTNNNNGEFPQQTQNLFHMRDRLFLALFFRVSLIYARAFPKTLRRILEFCLLMQSIILLFILTYIHVVYNQTPITCLGEYKNSWPKDGILRVEITTESGLDYNIQKSYEKEERLRQRASSENSHDDLLTMMLTADTLLLDKMVTTAGEFFQSVTSRKESQTEAPTSSDSEHTTPTLKPSETSTSFNVEDNEKEEIESSDGDGDSVSQDGLVKNSSDENVVEKDDDNSNSISPSFHHKEDAPALEQEGSAEKENYDVGVSGDDSESLYFNKTLEEIEIIKMNKKKQEEEEILRTSLSDFEMFANSVWQHDQAYIVEYALEYGFLRLSPETRQRLNIPVKIVTLDPSKDECFGDSLSRFLLDNFLGYDDILMSSIKNLAESEDNKGYLRNVVTGEQFRFVPMWMARSAYIPALLIMLVFTVSISMLLRYSHHQIFVFIVDLLNNIEGVGAIHIPAAPLFTVILALVGMEAIMSEFFNDTSTAFYVILIVWIADQYDSVCSHTLITRTYWVRFFYLYHFAFYAYHYRFNGQHGGLALLVSWSFIQHSMIYFYHHYELPTILRQAQPDDSANNIGTPNSATNSSFSPTVTQINASTASSGYTTTLTNSHNHDQPAGTSTLLSSATPVINVNIRPVIINNQSSTLAPGHEQRTENLSSSQDEPNQTQTFTSASNLDSGLLGRRFSNSIISDPVGLNISPDFSSPSTSSGLRLRTHILQTGEQTASTNNPALHSPQRYHESDDELD